MQSADTALHSAGNRALDTVLSQQEAVSPSCSE